MEARLLHLIVRLGKKIEREKIQDQGHLLNKTPLRPARRWDHSRVWLEEYNSSSYIPRAKLPKIYVKA